MDQTSGVVKVTEPLLVFGGPYSNLEATTALLEEARCPRWAVAGLL